MKKKWRYPRILADLFRAGRKAGANLAFYRALTLNSDLFKKVVRLAEEPTRNLVYDPLLVVECLGISYTRKQLADIPKPPGPLPGYLTFWDPGLSIREICKGVGSPTLVDDLFFEVDCGEALFQLLEDQMTSRGWRQLRIEPLAESFGKNYTAQKELLTDNEEFPSARVVILATMLHYLLTGRPLFKCWVRCSDHAPYPEPAEQRFIIGQFGGGLCVQMRHDGYAYSQLGLAPIRKS